MDRLNLILRNNFHLVKGKLVIISSLLSIGCIIYVTNRWFIARKNSEDKKRKKIPRDSAESIKECSVQLTRTDAMVLNNALNDLAFSVHQIEILMQKLSASDTSVAKSLEKKVLHLKYLLKDFHYTDELNDEKIEAKNHRKRVKNNKEKTTHIVKLEPEEIVDGDFENDDESLYSEDSFVSASEFQDSELKSMECTVVEQLELDEELHDLFAENGHLELYAMGIEEYSKAEILVRKLRTKMLNCKNDADFRIKLFCLRIAFQDLFQQDSWRTWFLQLGRKSLVDFLIKAGKDHLAFEREFDVIISYCQQKENWSDIGEELKARQVCAMTFYDIVLDFIIMDAFEDLEEPPYALIAVIQNGWLTNSIKETALTTAVWSLLKAKTRMLQNPDAFMSRLYLVSQYLTPVLVWGFLGPADENLKETCKTFKDAMVGFLVDIFSLEKANYSSSRTLGDDIIKIAKERSNHEYLIE